MKGVKAAFVIPAYIQNKVYNDFFEETMQSILNQSDNGWEAIIIDDDSKETGTRKLIEKYLRLDHRYHAIFLEERKSTGYCRNIGIRWAKKHDRIFCLMMQMISLTKIE